MRRLVFLAATAGIVFAPTATARTIRQTVPQMQEEAASVLKNCDAQSVLAIEIRDQQSISFRVLKEPAQRGERDLVALRCVAKHYGYLSTYAGMEALLLGIEPTNHSSTPTRVSE